MKRFSSRTGTILVAAVVAMIFAPTTVWAVDAFTNVAIQDPTTGVKAHVDSGGHVLVAASGQRPLPSASSWSSVQVPSLVTQSGQARQAVKSLTNATTAGIDLTSLTVSVPVASSSDWATVRLVELAPASGHTDCAPTIDSNPANLGLLYQVTVTGAAPLAVAFPTPLLLHGAAALGPICLGVQIIGGNIAAYVNASGYYGS